MPYEITTDVTKILTVLKQDVRTAVKTSAQCPKDSGHRKSPAPAPRHQDFSQNHSISQQLLIVDNLSEVSLQRCAANQSAVDVRLCEKLCRVARID